MNTCIFPGRKGVGLRGEREEKRKTEMQGEGEKASVGMCVN